MQLAVYEAMLDLARAAIYAKIGLEEAAFQAWSNDAYERAYRLGQEAKPSDTPHPLLLEHGLGSAWMEGRKFAAGQEEKTDTGSSASRGKAISHGAWKALGLPSPEELRDSLLALETVRICDHRLEYDPGHGVVWLTNPYGCDSILCHEPTTSACLAFLTRVANGHDYDPVPC